MRVWFARRFVPVRVGPNNGMVILRTASAMRWGA